MTTALFPAATRSRSASPQRRSSLLLIAVFVAVAILVAMLVRLQVVSPDRYVKKGTGQRYAEFPLVGLRGSILDRNGDSFAMSLPAKAVVADPRHVTNPELEAAKLAPILGMDAGLVQSILERPDTGFAYVARQLDPVVGERIDALRLPGINTQDESRRITANDDLAMSIVGRMDNLGERAQFGLESSYDKRLSGHTGKRTIERGGDGATIVGSEQIVDKPADGDTLELTIDRSMQFWAENALEEQVAKVGADHGTVIIGRPQTGEILAMASVITVDGEVRPSKLNYAVRTYEPGSVMKVSTAAAAFDTGTVKLDTTLTVPAQIKVGNYAVHDAEKHGTKEMSVADIIAQSSNVGTTKIAQQVGKDKLLHYLDGFGFGKQTNLGLDREQTGTFRRDWNGSDIGSIPIGQSITATPLQIWNMYNTIANGGQYVEPQLVRSWTSPTGKVTTPAITPPRRVISSDAAENVTRALERVVEDGTATEWKIPGYNIAAKTGTAYEPIGGGRTGYGTGGADRHYAASFAGFFPATNPQLSMIVMIDNPQQPNQFGAVAAGPVFDRLAREAMRQYGIAGDAPGSEAGTVTHPVRAEAAQAPTTAAPATTVAPTTIPSTTAPTSTTIPSTTIHPATIHSTTGPAASVPPPTIPPPTAPPASTRKSGG